MKQDTTAWKIAKTLYYDSDMGERLVSVSEIEETIMKIAGRDNRTLEAYKLLLLQLEYVQLASEDKYKVNKPKRPPKPTEIVEQARMRAEKRKRA